MVTAGGGGALVAYAVFKFLGRSWIETQLAKDLEAAKSEIAVLAARRLKLHDREYTVFPEVWSKLHQAVGSLGAALLSLRETPDFDSMSDNELAEWIKRSDLSENDRAYLSGERDKGRAFCRILDWRDIVKARKDFIEFHTFFQSNRIFISPDIKEPLDKITKLLHESWVAKKMDWDGYSRGAGTSFLIEAMDKHHQQIKPLMSEIETLVQKKLFPETG